MQKAKSVNAYDIIRLAAKLPDAKELPGLKAKLNTISDEIDSGGVTEERLTHICGEIDKIRETGDVISAVRPMLNNPSFVSNMCKQLVAYWEQTGTPEKMDPEEEPHPGNLKRHLSDDERDVYDMINNT